MNMKKLQRKAALLLSLGLFTATAPFGKTVVYADDSLSEMTDRPYAEGEVIVCVDESAFPGKSYAQDKDESYKVDRDTSEILSTLNGAEELIDVTGAVTGSDKAGEPLGLGDRVEGEDIFPERGYV